MFIYVSNRALGVGLAWLKCTVLSLRNWSDWFITYHIHVAKIGVNTGPISEHFAFRYELLKERGQVLTGTRLEDALLSHNIADSVDEHTLDEQIKYLTEKSEKLSGRKHALKQISSDLG